MVIVAVVSVCLISMLLYCLFYFILKIMKIVSAWLNQRE